MKSFRIKILTLILAILIPLQALAEEQCDVSPEMSIMISRAREDLLKLSAVINKTQCKSIIEQKTHYFTSGKFLEFSLSSRLDKSKLSLKTGLTTFTNFWPANALNSRTQYWPKTREIKTFDEMISRIYDAAKQADAHCSDMDAPVDDGGQVSLSQFFTDTLDKISNTQEDIVNDFDKYLQDTDPEDLDKTPSYTLDLYKEDKGSVTELNDYYGKTSLTICPDPNNLGGLIIKIKQLEKNINSVWINLNNMWKTVKQGKDNFKQMGQKQFYLDIGSQIAATHESIFTKQFAKIVDIADTFFKSLGDFFAPDEDKQTAPIPALQYYINEEQYAEDLQRTTIDNTRIDNAIRAVGDFEKEDNLRITNYTMDNYDILGPSSASKNTDEEFVLNRIFLENYKVCQDTRPAYCEYKKGSTLLEILNTIKSENIEAQKKAREETQDTGAQEDSPGF